MARTGSQTYHPSLQSTITQIAYAGVGGPTDYGNLQTTSKGLEVVTNWSIILGLLS